MSKLWSRSVVTVMCLFVAVLCFAQPKFNSPYSRIGLGDPANLNFASLNGMGDLSAALHDPFHINLLNPASLSQLKATAFEVGIRAKYGNLKSDTEDLGVWSGNLSYLSLAFPLSNPINEVLDRKPSKVDWGMNFALVPYTFVGYDVKSEEVVNNIDKIEYLFQGTGGTYKFMWGNGVKMGNISAGVNLGYLFGKITRDQQVQFDSLEASYQDILQDGMSVNGFVWNAGVQYDLILKERKSGDNDRIVFGLYGNSEMDFTAKTNQLYRRFNPAYNDVDTIRNNPLVEQSGRLPAEFSIGAMYQKDNKLRLGLNYSQAFWSNYRNEAKPENLKDSWRVSVGGEYLPEKNFFNSYAKVIRYRFGLFYSTDSRSDEFNKQLTSYGITLGLGLPIILPRQQKSFVNLAFELGQFGTEQSLQETYIKMTVGFTLNDSGWFLKRKFN